jgi:hypothetical protein
MKTFEQQIADLQRVSGKTIKELQAEVKERRSAALHRLKDLNIPLPFPELTPRNTTVEIMDGTLRVYTSSLAEGNGFKAYRLITIASFTIEADCKLWYHVSFSRQDCIPTYADTRFVKRYIIGSDRAAYQVFPKASEHVSDHDRCLHLWHCLEGDPLPDFRKYESI